MFSICREHGILITLLTTENGQTLPTPHRNGMFYPSSVDTQGRYVGETLGIVPVRTNHIKRGYNALIIITGQ